MDDMEPTRISSLAHWIFNVVGVDSGIIASVTDVGSSNEIENGSITLLQNECLLLKGTMFWLFDV
jgi:hypothetical protein